MQRQSITYFDICMNADVSMIDKKLEEVDEFAEERKKTLAVLEKVIGVKPMKQGKKPNARLTILILGLCA